MGIISDPIHGFIQLSAHERKVVDSLVFQRLRNLQQLQHASLVFPSATHTRFSHSLGAMHVAGDICNALDLDDAERTRSIRLAALTHDVGHGPYSHVFENIAKRLCGDDGFNHELFTRFLLENDEDLKGRLQPNLDSVLDVLSADQDTVDHAVVSGSLDADEMDYLQRDAYFAGLSGARFDYPRLVSSLKNYRDRAIIVSRRGIQAADGFRAARFQIQRTVHHHHAAHAAEGMLLKAIIAECENKPHLRDRFSMKYNRENPNWLLGMGDTAFMQWLDSEAESESAKDILQLLRRRQLYKRASQFTPKEIEDAYQRDRLEKLSLPDIEARISERAGVPTAHVIVQKIRVDIKQFLTSHDQAQELPILVEGKEGKPPQDFDEVGYPIMRGPAEHTRKIYYIFSHPKDRGKIQSAAAETLAAL